MNSESLRRSARAMHSDSGSAKREKVVTTATIHYLRGRAPELRMATHLEDAQRPFQRALPARVADSSSLAASNLASCPDRNPSRIPCSGRFWNQGCLEAEQNKWGCLNRRWYTTRTRNFASA